MQRDYEGASRLRLKRSLLDKLAQNYDFAVPPGMVELEFDSIWRQYEAEKARAAKPEAASPEVSDGGRARSRCRYGRSGEPGNSDRRGRRSRLGSRARRRNPRARLAPTRPQPVSSKPTRRKTRRP